MRRGKWGWDKVEREKKENGGRIWKRKGRWEVKRRGE